MINFLLTQTPLFYWVQSLWRDEAFSVWIANGTLRDVIVRTSGDFNPPLYYLLLNIWMKFFGTSETSARAISLLFFFFFLYIVYKLATLIFKSTQMAVITTLIALLCPMLLYFAFELRMYSLLALFAALATYFLLKKQWILYVLAAAAGMYTQPFMAFVLASHFVYLLLTMHLRTAIFVFIGIGLLYLPWVPTIVSQFSHSGPMWMFPVDRNLFEAVLGNVFMGYEGTPGGLWEKMKLLSLGILVVSGIALLFQKNRKAVLLLALITYLPLLLVLGISIKKPIYVHRYVIFVAFGEVFMIAAFLATLPRKLRAFLASCIITFLIFANSWAIAFHQKVDFQSTFFSVNEKLRPGDSVVADSPLSYYESWYYTNKDFPVYLYNPEKTEPPRFVGSVGMPEQVWIDRYPLYPKRAFVISENGKYTTISILVKPSAL